MGGIGVPAGFKEQLPAKGLARKPGIARDERSASRGRKDGQREDDEQS